MRVPVPILLLSLALLGGGAATPGAREPRVVPRAPERVRPNDNRVPAGVLRGGVLTLRLHGFYFRVDSRGDGVADTVYRDGVPRMANTEAMAVGAVMSLTWVPERQGNWLFHCHIPEHFAPRGPLGAPPADPHAAHAGAGHAMGGLVLGIAVRDTGTGARTVAVARAPDDARRSLRLLVRENGGSTADVPRSTASRRTRAAPPSRRPTRGAAPGRRSC